MYSAFYIFFLNHVSLFEKGYLPVRTEILSKLVWSLLTSTALPTPNIFQHLLCVPLIIFEILSSPMLLLVSHRQIQRKTHLKRAAKVPLSCSLECPLAQGLLFSLYDTYTPLGHIQQSESSRPAPSGTPWPKSKERQVYRCNFSF